MAEINEEKGYTGQDATELGNPPKPEDVQTAGEQVKPEPAEDEPAEDEPAPPAP